jgi:hypothetical protein
VTVLHELEEARPGLETLLADVLRSAFGAEPDIPPLGADAPWSGAGNQSAGVAGVAAVPAGGVLAREPDAAAAAPPAYALLAIGDVSGGGLLGVQLRLEGRLAHALAARMFASDAPATGDLLDAVGELAKVMGGNVKALLFTRSGPARLSLPSTVLGRPAGRPPARHALPAPREGALLQVGGDAAPTTIRALVLGEVAELTLIPHLPAGDLIWPDAVDSHVPAGRS